MDLLAGVVGILLKALGVFAGIVLIAAAWFAIKFRGTLRVLLAGGAPTPSQISLLRRDEPSWVRKKRARLEAQAFQAAGFRAIGVFEISEIPGAELLAFVHAEAHMYGVIYRHPAAGIWSDVVIRYDDETGRTMSSAPSGGELDHPPWTHNRYEPGAGAQRLIELGRAAPSEGRAETSAARFEADFTGDYARTMAWRNERGGVTLSEIERVAVHSDMELAEGEAEVAHAAARRQMIERLRSECLERLLADPGLSAADARAVTEEGVVVIHDPMTPGEVLDELCSAAEVPDETLAVLEGVAAGGGDARDLFPALAAQLPEGMTARRVGSVQEPVRADVWVVEIAGAAAQG